MLRAAAGVALAVAVLAAPVAVAAKGDIERVSVATGGAQGDGDSAAPAISRDGRVVAFESLATNLAGGDGNGGVDVFTRSRSSGQTQRVSGVPGVSAGSSAPAISADGGTVAFESFAPELGGGVFGDVFLRRGGGAIVRVSHETGNGDDVSGFAPSVSADGATVVFQSAGQDLIADDENGLSDVFSSRGGSISRISESAGGTEANGFSDQPALSSDGRFVVFRSEATNLTSQSDEVATWDIFVAGLSGGTERVSGGLGGAPSDGDSEDPAISSNGSVVAFQSTASNLVAGDTNERTDVFVHDLNANLTERVSVASDGAQSATNSFQPSISGDGRLVAFASTDSDITPGDTNNVIDVFVHDRSTGATERVSFRRGFPSGGSGGDSLAPALSADGCFVAFETEGFGAFVPDDTNGDADIHVADLGCGGAAPAAPGGSDPVGPADPIGTQPPATDPSGRPRDPVASPVRGTVRVRIPGSRRFARLRRGTPLPAGSEIDTRRGVLRLVVGRSSALVSRGRAIVRGATLTLTDRRLLVRSLAGRFRTRTPHATTSGVRAAWLTVVRRGGTVVTARRGRVAVRDLARRRTVRLRGGERYRAVRPR